MSISRRPSVRKSDLHAAWAAALALGLRPRSTRFHADGGFSIDFDDTPSSIIDPIDAELAAFEAKHGQGRA